MSELIPNELARALVRVYANVSRIPKNGKNDFHGYSYVMEGDLVDHLRGLLAEEGVAVFPSVREHVVEVTEDHRKRQQFMATVTLDVTFIHGDSGQQHTTSWVGQGVDNGDKSYYKAYTGAFKYALMKTFLISAGDDPEEEGARRRPENGGGGGDSKPSRAPSTPQKTTLPEKDHSQDEAWKTQSKRFFALASEANVSDDENHAYREWFKEQLGAKSWTHIPTDKLQGLNDALQKLDLEERGARMRSKG